MADHDDDAAAPAPAPPAASPESPGELPVSAERDLARGLMLVHDLIGSNISGAQQLAAQLYALTEALIARGVVSLADVERRKRVALEQIVEESEQQWEGARMLADESDKYTSPAAVTIDCESRLPLCKAACCRLSVYLSRQDLDEGVVRWDYTRPYHLRQAPDGYCAHSDPATRRCGVHAQRPLTCREYDCRKDARIWVDFEKRIPNPELEKL